MRAFHGRERQAMRPAFRFSFQSLFLVAALLAAFPFEPCAQTGEPLLATGSSPKADEPILAVEAGLHSASLRIMATDAKNRFLVTGSVDKTVRVWDLPTGKLLGILRPPIGKGNEGIILAVDVSPDGDTIACGGRTRESEKSRQIYLFDRESRRLLKRIPGLPESITFLRFSRDGSMLAVGLGGSGGLRVFSISRKGDRIDAAPAGDDPNYGDSIRGVDFDSAGRLAVSSSDGALRLYSREFRLIAKQTVSRKEGPSGVRFSPDASRIALGYFEAARVDVFPAGDLKLLETPLVGRTQSRMPRLMAVDWSPDGRHLYAAGNFGQRGKNVIVRWPAENLHAPTYVPVKWTVIRNILALRDGNVLYGGVSGDMALIDSSGREIYAKSPNLDYLTGKTFSISPDAMTVKFDFLQAGGVPATFSVESRQLELNPMPNLKLTDPILKASGIELTDWMLKSDPKLNGKLLSLRSHDQGTAYAIAPDHRSFVYGTWFYLYRFDPGGKEIWYRPIPGAVRAVNISGDGRLAVVGISDGTIRWYRMKDGRELLAFYPNSDRKRWVIWTPSGYYDASEGGDELIGWHVNNGLDREASFYPVSRFFERFYRPELMARVIKGVEADTAVVASLGEKAAPDIEAAGIKPPPEVAILSPLPGKQFESDEQQVKIVVEDMGGGIDEVLLYQNGKILPRDAGTQVRKEGSTQEHLYRVKLIEGTNQFKATAFSRDRIEGNPMEITVALRGAEKESDLHLVVIGINRYKNAALNLTYAETDAKGIQTFFQTGDVKKLFKNVHVYSLISEQATGQNIKNLFGEVGKKAQPQDTLLLYLAGHGDTVGEEWYFIPHDVVSPEIEGDLKKGGISNGAISEAIKQCKAQKVFVMIDACKSGKLILAMRSTEARKALVQLARSTGTYIVSASTDQQYAAEIKALGHGVFTYTLLEGLKGTGGQKKVTVEGLIHYVKEKLPELTEKHRGQAQYPVSWGSGMDFPLVLH
jgi:WD40 repeat protein